jgi:hypothetical protein
MPLRAYWTRLARTIDDYLTLRPHLRPPIVLGPHKLRDTSARRRCISRHCAVQALTPCRG